MRKHLTDEEQALWAQVAGSVRPLQARTSDSAAITVPVTPAKEALTSPTVLEIAEASRMHASAPRSISHPASPLVPQDRRSAARRFARHARVDATLDLHGMTQEIAYAAVVDFLQRQVQSGARHLVIITGKGQRSGNAEGALKRQLPLWLEQVPQRRCISAIAYAAEREGGEGALHLLLKSSRISRHTQRHD